MSNTTELQELDTCGCCESALPPRSQHNNAPGQPEIAYRIGRYSSFMRRMLERVPFQAIPDGPNIGRRPLAGLVTGGNQDPAVAMLDAWASSLDVLTFYQERIANEGYLRTAAERRSVLELARTIGYELNPGVAASTHLVFTVESALGNTTDVTVPIGTKVQNVPVTQTLPQTFETVEEIEARADLNVLYARRTKLQQLTSSSTGVYLKGVATLLQTGDTLLIVGYGRRGTSSGAQASQEWYAVTVTSITINAREGYTYVSWGNTLLALTGKNYYLTDPQVFAMRQRAALFGHNAPDWKSMSQSIKDAYDNGTDWPNMTMAANAPFDLDIAYPKMYGGGWIIVTGITSTGTTATRLYNITSASTITKAEFTISGRVTRIVHDNNEAIEFRRRDTLVFGQSEQLELVEPPDTDFVDGLTLELANVAQRLEVGRKVVISGRRGRVKINTGGISITYVGPDQIPVSKTLEQGEILTVLQRVNAGGGMSLTLQRRDGFIGTAPFSSATTVLEPYPADPDSPVLSGVYTISLNSSTLEHTTIGLNQPLFAVLDRASVEVYGNVAYATHGETVAEVLGSGDGSRTNQAFSLKKPPLTYVPAATASGNKTTLELRVNGVRWSEVPFLFGRGTREQIYMVRMNNDGVTSVVFGDGKNGVRLPTGLENVTAVYRSGIGPDGDVESNTLTLLQTRPLGIRSVNNPLPAGGSAPPERIEQARSNAPRTVLTFDRVVSLNDFESFARGFAGIGKAQGTLVWSGNHRIVYLTVGGTSGAEALAVTRTNLLTALATLQDPIVQVEVGTYDKVTFNVAVKLAIDDRYIEQDVKDAARAALIDAFSFDKRAFGQRVTVAEVMGVLQKVPGVIGVDVDALYTPYTANNQGDVLTAGIAHIKDGQLKPAQLLLINPAGITITKMVG